MSINARLGNIIAAAIVCVVGVTTPTISLAQQAKPGGTAPLREEAAFDTSFSKLPTNITADSLNLNAKTRIFIYKGNVTVTQGDMTLVSNILEGTYSDKNQIQKLVAKGDVAITKQDIHATSQIAWYDAGDATVTLSDNPQLQQGESMLTADRIKVFLNENRSQAEGAVRVTLVQDKDSKNGGATSPLGQMAGSNKASSSKVQNSQQR